ncbi:hypothetical protein FAM23852_000188 [Propionibacterium freudenreichii]|uniref:hypothetical protein n=1 Tax=Propionibacterium freudenreichii TaxID=1744 RepID=UPI00254C40A2|nr:hypothetical protein [Propionibacterium freudenreichii]MDK9320759.1 hypothetical protein [Propionibacterium freudenreichii]MDK9323245.1 hypothetical protein [Propionibacterium freudenreichii]
MSTAAAATAATSASQRTTEVLIAHSPAVAGALMARIRPRMRAVGPPWAGFAAGVATSWAACRALSAAVAMSAQPTASGPSTAVVPKNWKGTAQLCQAGIVGTE